MSPLNQQLLADRLHLSRTTVSRGLANHPSVGADTRARVQALAAELGYAGPGPRLKRRPGRRRATTVGVLIGVPAENVELATFPFILRGIRQRAAMENLGVDVCYENPGAPDLASQNQRIFRAMRAGDWRGAILIYAFPDDAVDAIAARVPAVAVLAHYRVPALDSIDTDDSTAILGLVSRLVEAGHRRIGFLAWDYPVNGIWTTRRFGGYAEAVFQHGLEFRSDWVINIHRGQRHFAENEITGEVMRRLRDEGVTAWVCAADHQAYRLIQELRSRGVRVPEDCSVTGFDGLASPVDTPRVTSMAVPHEEIGTSAVARVLSRMMHPESPRRTILVEARFVEGQTIAPAPVTVVAPRPAEPRARAVRIVT